MIQSTRKRKPKFFLKVLLIAGGLVLVIGAFFVGRYIEEYQNLKKAQQAKVQKEEQQAAQQAKVHRENLIRHMAFIPAGDFVMGTSRENEKPIPSASAFRRLPYENEEPRHTVYLPAFYIDMFETTHIEYNEFIKATHTPPSAYWKDLDLRKFKLYPVVNVSWFDADRYCKWRGKQLPTEAQWEKAARGTDGRRFPWGNAFDKDKTNTQQKGLAPVGFFVGDVSPYGVHDLAGNVAEWVDSWYKPYPGNESEDPDFGEKLRVIRGGSWGGVGHYNLSFLVRTTYRASGDPARGYNDVGFRCSLPAEVVK